MRTLKAVAAAALATGFLVSQAPTASAEIGYYSYTNTEGWGAEAMLYPKGQEPKDYDYRVAFYDYGESLTLEDRITDGHHAKAYVKVYNKSGTIVDRDTFILPSNTTYKKYNLGTPDGSGDISEGYLVEIQVCMNGGCTQEARAKA